MSARDQYQERHQREFAEQEQLRQELFGPDRYTAKTMEQDKEERSKIPQPAPAAQFDWNQLYQNVLDKKNMEREIMAPVRDLARGARMMRSIISPRPAEALYQRLEQPPPEGVAPKSEQSGTQDPRYANAPTWPVDPETSFKCPCCQPPKATASPEGNDESIIETPLYLPCGHIVGDNCVNKSVINLRGNAGCPVCRHPLFTKEEAEAFRAYDRDMGWASC